MTSWRMPCDCTMMQSLIWPCACVRSAGQQHRQLVKSGNDDLRQDAVMQQFFGLINALLAANPAAAKRRLSMATYKARPVILAFLLHATLQF